MQKIKCCKIKGLDALPESARDLLCPLLGAVEPRGEFIVGSRSLGRMKGILALRPDGLGNRANKVAGWNH